MHPDIRKLYQDIRDGKLDRAAAGQAMRTLRRSLGPQARLAHGDPYLADHLIGADQVVIGVTYAALAIQAFFDAHPGTPTAVLRNLQFVDPVGVATGKSVELRTDIATNGSFAVAYRPTPADAWKSAATGLLEAASPLVAARSDTVLPAVAPEALYTANPFVTWGPTFRTVVSAAASDSQAVLEFALPPGVVEGFDPSALALDPRLLNSLLYGAFAIMIRRSLTCRFLPLSVVRLQAAAERGAGPYNVNVRLVRMSEEMVTVDADIADAFGQPVLRCEGLGFKRMRQEIEAARPKAAVVASHSEPSGVIQAYLTAEAERILGGPIEDASRNLLDLGFDSAGLVALAGRLQDQLGIELFPPVFFEYPSLRELAGYFLAHHRAAVLDHVAERAPDPVVAAPAATPIANERPHRAAVRADEPIAIIGMDGRFAASPDLDSFWTNLVENHPMITEVPPDRWNLADWFDADRAAEHRTYCKWGSFIDDIAAFDPLFFNVSPQQATWLDPQVRHLMEVAYGAAEDAGYSTHLRGGRIGVYAGACFQEYWDEIIRNKIALTGHEHTSSYRSSIATHVSYGLDLQGPSVPVDSACASSLTALHLACQALRAGDCDMAFACGTNLLISPLQFVYFSRIQAMSPSGRCHTFDRRADGFIPGEGAVALLLKPLAQAERDGDNIHAVIRGSAINHTGRSPNPTAPRPELQTQVLRAAWNNAGILPEQLSYLECHGTGTQLGDPIEINAIKKAFGDAAAAPGSCVLGSAKAHIGHLEGAAGLAGVVKVVQSMKHRTVPRMPEFEELNPMIKLEGSPFRINRETEAWPAGSGPRLAGVSGFGMTGNGAHVVVEEYVRPPVVDAAASGPQVVILSAKNEAQLRAQARRLRDVLEREPRGLRLADVACTLQVGREAFEERLGFVAADLADACRRLDAFLEASPRPGAFHHRRVPRGQAPVAPMMAGGMQACLDAWMKGAIIDWAALAAADPEKPRRISLPGYAFAREHYWFPMETSEIAAPGSPTVRLDGLVFQPTWQAAATPGAATPSFHRPLIVAATDAPLADALAAMLPGSVRADALDRVPTSGAAFDALFFFASRPEDEVLLLKLIQRLGKQLGSRQALHCFVVSQDRDPVGAGVIGLAYSLAQGDARFHVRNIALAALEGADPRRHAALLSAVLREPGDPRGDLVRFEDDRRLGRRFEPLDLAAVLQPAFRRGGIYVLVGGAGIVGSVVTRHLLETYGATVVWIGRSPMASVSARLAALEGSGGRLRYVQADATRPAEMRATIAAIGRECGSINGVIFAPVVFSFANSIAETSEAAFREILDVKAAGSVAVYEAVRDLPLDFLCFFSSCQAFAFSGAAQLSAYAAGITYADAFAQAIARDAPFPVGIINWGFWRAFTQGDLWRRYQAQNPEAAQERHIGFLEDAEGIACLERFLAQLREGGTRQVACLRPSEIVADLMRRGSEPTVMVAAAPAPARAGGSRWRDFLAACVSDVLQLPASRIEDDVPFIEYGFDSITSAGFVTRLNRELGCTVSATVLYDHPTLAALTAYLSRTLPDARIAPVAEPIAVKPAPSSDAIAVIGMALQVPGAATPETFWDILATGRNVTGPVPRGRCPAGEDPTRYAGVRVGILADRDAFDPLFFNISPREAEDMSPYQRLILREAWRCLEDAGLNPKGLAGSETGVFIGAEPPSFARASLTGGSEALIAARVSYFLNFKGPALVVNTGCSSSAVALHLACESLRRGESALALAGGIFADIGPETLRLLSGIGMVSPSGTCRPFDARADGTVLSEAVAMVALKRLDEALRDGDPIHGVIVCSATNQDGASNGITAPNGASQEALLRKVYDGGPVDPAGISYVEAHGTGTNLGDPIEVNALSRVFGSHPADAGFRALGSAKANIGHTSAAAGIVGLIKVLLSLSHETIPALSGFAQLNPKIEGGGFQIDSASRPWPRSSRGPRRAGLSAFGHSGSNVHVVLEEAPLVDLPIAHESLRPYVMPLSARTPALLQRQAMALLEHLRTTDAQALDLAGVAWTLQSGRAAMAARIVFLVRDLAELQDKLTAFLAGDTATVAATREPTSPESVAARWMGGGAVDWASLQGQTLPRRLSLPPSAFADKVFSVTAAADMPAPVAAEERREAPIWLPTWRDMPSTAPVVPLDPQSVLIVGTAAGSTLASELERAERALGSTVVRRDLLAGGTMSEDVPGRVYLLAWKPEVDQAITTDAVVELALLALMQHLKRITGAVRQIDLFVITADAAPTMGAGATGLAYGLAQSDHRFKVRNIGVDPSDGDASALAERIMAEPPSNRGDRIRLSGGSRLGLTFPQLAELPEDLGDGLRHGGTYVIVGGSGTVGGVITRCLCQDYQARVIWLGRSSTDSPKVRRSLAAFSGANAPVYLQADVTDAASLRNAVRTIEARGWAINGAIFSGLAFAFEDTIERANPTTFREIFDVKVKGGLNFHRAFADQGLDFLCWFSSSQAFSFSGATQFTSYAAAITAADRLVDRLREETRVPVGLLNWGFWKSSVENEQLGSNIDFIEDEEGWTAFRSFVALLRAGRLTQAACLRPSSLVRGLMTGADDHVRLAPRAAVSGMPSRPAARPGELIQLRADRQPPELDSWMVRLLHKAIGDPRVQAGIAPKYAKWLSEAEAALARHGAVEIPDDVEAQWQRFRDRSRHDLRWQAQIDLLDGCLAALPRVLRGEVPATEILFPGGSSEKVEGVYSRNPLFDFLNGMVAEAAGAFLDDRVAAEPDARLRVVEIGAGTGGTTGPVLAHLGQRSDIEEYLFTDVSRSFLLKADARWGRDHPYLRTQLWNIERDAETQDIAVGAYDVAIATNVLHATRDIRATLRHAKSALKQGGILLINEITENGLYGTLTFGLLDGWWLYDDDHLRIPGSPLLSPGTWQQVLEEAGFQSIEFLAGDAAEGGHHVIRAVSDGVLLPERAPVQAAVPARRRDPVVAAVEPAKPADRARFRDLIVAALGTTLKLPVAEISTGTPLADYGVDSILGISFIDAINRELGLSLNPAVVFEYSTADRLADHVASLVQCDALSAPLPAAAVTRPVETPAPRQVSPATPPGAIAIIGLSGQFPDAADTNVFWANLLAGHDAVRELPPAYLAARRPEMRAFKWGGLLEDRDCFDPLFFAITPREAESMNPHQRLVLQESWRALEDAALDPGRLDGQRVGIYIGAEPAHYVHESFSGQSDALVAARLAYFLNLRGPAMVVNTGCSSGAVALHLACESLRSGETSVALAGGVCANLDNAELLNLLEIGMLSPTGRCHTFSAEADGTVMSEAVAVVVLKRLDDALRDGDPIHATIVASGVNQDGASNGITAPNGAAQEALICETYERFGIAPDSIGYVETHGTGTTLGDVVEANALTRAFGRFTRERHFCLLGSAKTHIGHTSSASGVVGLIKVVLAMRHATIPGQLHFNGLNPLIDAANAPFQVAAATQRWERRGDRPRTAVLNCFGHSGTNAHFVIQDIVADDRAFALADPSQPVVVPLSARNKAQLVEVARRLEQALAAPAATVVQGANAAVIVVELLAGLLHVDGAELAAGDSLDDLGLTPQHLAQLCERLEARLGCAIPARDVRAWHSVGSIIDSVRPDVATAVADGEIDLASVAWTLQRGRKALHERAVFVVASLDDLRGALRDFANGTVDKDKCWTGQADGGSELAALLSDDDDLQETVSRWVRRGKLGKLAALWCRGCAVPWELLPRPQHARLLHLPTYPFARDRYRKPSPLPVFVQPMAMANLGSLLLHENTSTLFQQRFTTRFSGAETFLADHRVGDRAVLPAVAAIEMARAAAVAATGRPASGLCLRNLCWPQPLVVADTEITVHTVVALGREGDADTLQIEIRHSDATLLFSADAAWTIDTPASLDLGALRQRHPGQGMSSGEIYRQIEATGVHLGPAHRAIEAIHAADGSCLARVALPASLVGSRDSYGLHPSLMDAALQAIIALQGPQARPMLPYTVDRLDILALQQERLHVWCRRDGASQKFDLDLLSDAGEICVAIRGLSLRDARPATTGLTGPVLLAPVWDVVSPAPEVCGGEGALLFCGSDGECERWYVQAGVRASRLLPLAPGLSIDAIQQRLAGIDPPAGIAWVAPAASTGDPIAEQEAAVVPFFRLIKASLKNGWEARPIVWTVLTRNGVAVSADDRIDAAQASLLGLIGSLAKESSSWQFRIVDLGADAADDPTFDTIVTLPIDPAGEALAWRGKQWFQRQLVAIVPPAALADGTYAPSEGVTVVVGGAGGIGKVWSEQMIRRHRARIVWLGRRPLDADIQREIARLGQFGPAPDYVQADASDAAQLRDAVLRIGRDHGPIEGLVHSAIVLADRTMLTMSEAQLRQVLQPKVDAAVRMAEAFAQEPLAFVLFFSSVQSFLKMPGQGNYAAGSCFIDAFASSLRRRLSCPVKVMNWGYWGDVGIVSTPEYRQRMADAGMGSITPAEAMEALDLLFRGGFDQIALMKPERPLAIGGLASDRRLAMAPLADASLLDGATVSLPDSGPEIDYIRSGGDFRMAEMEPFLRAIVAAHLGALGLSDGDGHGIVAQPYLRRWLDHARTFLNATSGGVPSVAEAWRAWDEAKGAWLAHASKRAQVVLVETALRALPDILLARRSAPSVLFPGSSLSMVEAVYKENLVARYFNLVLAGAFAGIVERHAGRHPGRPLRILEIGAGTGGTSAVLFRTLAERGLSAAVGEYLYTDISNAFLVHAQEHYAPDAPFLRTRRLDISEALGGQDVPEGVFDIVIAANSLHTTQDIRRAVRHAKSALKQGGVLLLNEISSATLYAYLTFGLLEGWWLFHDGALRIEGCPGLSPASWRHVLETEGFGSIDFPAEERHELGLQIIVAESDGVIRAQVEQRAALPQARPAVTAPSEQMPQEMTAWLKALVARVTRIPLGEIDSKRPLEAYGIDSIVVIQLAKELRTLLPDASATLFFEHQTIQALADHLTGTRQAELAAHFAAAAEPSDTVPAVVMPPVVMPPVVAKPPRQLAQARRAVAVVGMAGRYPGAPDLDAFWANLAEGRNCIVELPSERWAWQDYFDPAPGKTGAAYARFGGFLSDIDCFDPLFFGISPVEAEAMHPQERLFLEAAWSCIEDAGHTPATLSPRKKVGVFVGVMNDTYHRGSKHWSVANRVSYHCDFRGPSIAVDTACSSSLTALHFALESIASGSCDCALAGGVNLVTNPLHTIGLSALRVLASDGRNKTFSADADGFVDGEGIGVVLLKPLDAAVADGDHIYGVILGSAINAGGKVNGYTVPNPAAQADVVAEALERAGVDARTISYVEAHGTGTVLGDPIEVAGLTTAFRRQTADIGFCSIGSVKSNIGHGESAAGIAGLTKILLQMTYAKLVPTLHAAPVNPEIDFARSPFRVQAELADWQTSPGLPRRAGLSSFGAGGANAHVIVEDYAATLEARESRGAVLLPLSAKTPDQLREMIANLRSRMERAADRLPLADIAFTLQQGRVAFEHRFAIVAETTESAMAKLRVGADSESTAAGVFRGNARRAQAPAAGAVDAAVAAGDLDTLAALWVQGATPDWTRLAPAGGSRRVSLPTYPFARERYWKPDLPHPAKLRETAETSYTFSFTGTEPFLRDHQVGGVPVLPGVAYLDLARQALARIVRTDVVAFDDVVWITPFKPAAAGATLRLEIAPTTEGQGRFTFISGDGGAAIVHCKGQATWSATRPAAPPAKPIAALAAACRAGRVAPDALQAVYRRLGVQYGPSHLALGPVELGVDQALARLALPPATPIDADGGALPPGLLDSAFQACLCLVDGMLESGTEAPLPFGLRHLEIHAPCHKVAWAHLSRRRQGSEASRVEVDLDLLAEDGTVCLRFQGLSSRVSAPKRSGEAAMNELLGQLARASLPDKPAIRPFYGPWLAQTEAFLSEVPASPAPMAALWRQWQAERQGWLDDPILRPRVRLLEAVLPALPAVLTGATKATDILFPKASLDLVEPIYNANPISDAFNGRVVEAIVGWIEARARQVQDGQGLGLRILEIGAGTGGTSRRVLEGLALWRAHLAEYLYTDRSHVFLQHAEATFGAANPFLRCALLDIEKPIDEQGLTDGTFDIVIAANVLHATHDMRRTLRQVRRTLRDGGLLVLNELAGNALYAHLTFGLLEGWWDYEDAELRLPGSPGLSPQTWQSLLEEQGFAEIGFPAADKHALGQQVVTASAGHAAVFEIIREAQQIGDEEAKRRFVRRTIREHVAGSIKLDETRLEDDRSFSDYGVDSILAVNLVNDIADAVNAPLTTTVLFDYNTVELLTRHILDAYGDRLPSIAAVPAAAPAPAPPVENVALRALLQAFDDADPQPRQTVLLLTSDPEIAEIAAWSAREREIDLIVGAGSPDLLQDVDGERRLLFDGPDFHARLLDLNQQRKVDHVICALANGPDELASVLSDDGQWLDLA